MGDELRATTDRGRAVMATRDLSGRLAILMVDSSSWLEAWLEGRSVRVEFYRPVREPQGGTVVRAVTKTGPPAKCVRELLAGTSVADPAGLAAELERRAKADLERRKAAR